MQCNISATLAEQYRHLIRHFLERLWHSWALLDTWNTPTGQSGLQVFGRQKNPYIMKSLPPKVTSPDGLNDVYLLALSMVGTMFLNILKTKSKAAHTWGGKRIRLWSQPRRHRETLYQQKRKPKPRTIQWRQRQNLSTLPPGDLGNVVVNYSAQRSTPKSI